MALHALACRPPLFYLEEVEEKRKVGISLFSDLLKCE
jgi:hypothetical protein